jgi:hypothetical protein
LSIDGRRSLLSKYDFDIDHRASPIKRRVEVSAGHRLASLAIEIHAKERASFFDARGQAMACETGMADVLKMTDKLEAEFPTMLSEHKDILAALSKLIEAARTENKPDVVHFAEKLCSTPKPRSKSPIQLRS